MTSCSNVFYNGTRFVIDINLDTVNIAVSHVGDREVNDSVSAKEGKRADRAIILHTIYINISPGRFTIPNALYILFCPLYTFRYKLDVLAVWIAYNSTLADTDTISYK